MGKNRLNLEPQDHFHIPMQSRETEVVKKQHRGLFRSRGRVLGTKSDLGFLMRSMTDQGEPKSEVKWNKMGLHSLSYQDHLMDEP